MSSSVNKRYVPKLRFRGFEGEYLKVYCKEISTILGVGVDKMKKQNEKIVQFVNFVDVYKNRFIDNQQDLLKTTCSDQEFKKFMLQYGDILITPSSENKTDIGLTCMINFKPINLVYSYHLNLMRFNLKIIEPLWISYYFYTNKSRKYFYKVSSGITRYTLNKNNLENFEITYPPIIDEQVKISTFLKLLDKQISLLENKLTLTEQMKEYYKNFIFKLFFQHSKKQEFNKIFKKYKLFANDETLKQVTIGKTGLNIINKTNYKINNHKLIEINSLIIGIGIEEINFNLNLEKICCSPIYQTYRLNDEFNNIFICYFISKIISKNRNLITKKSTRREYEVIIKDLEKLKIPIPNSREQYKFGNLMLDLDLMIQKLNNKIKLMKKRKLFYLNNLFI